MPKVKELINAPGQRQDLAFFRLVKKFRKDGMKKGELTQAKSGKLANREI